MTPKEIQKIINTKGRIVQDSYNLLVELAKNEYNESDDVSAIFSFNTTIRLMKKVLDNKDFFMENSTLNERNISRIQKDLKKMSFIEYPSSDNDNILECYESVITENFGPK